MRKFIGNGLNRIGLWLYRLGSRIRGRRQTQVEAITSHPAYRKRLPNMRPLPG